VALGGEPFHCCGVISVNQKFRPPLSGGEFTQLVDTGSQQVPSNASRVKLIPVGDSETGSCLPLATRQKRRKPLLPSPEEMARLPLRAQLALTARCVRRVLLVVTTTQKNQHDTTSNELKHAAEIIEQSASGTAPKTKAADITQLVKQVIEGLAAIHGRMIKDVTPDHIHSLARTATAEVAAILTDFGFSSSQLTVVRHDFDRLARLARLYAWTDETPVSAEVFGPLWQRGWDM
jgi:hypothetical protein